MMEQAVSKIGNPGLKAALGLAAGACIVLASPGVARATPHHAHHHYHMGVRAYAGTRHAAMLHLEAASAGCELGLARDNASDMERLAGELLRRGERLESLLSEREAELIGADVERMQALALGARRQAAELGAWIDEGLALAARDGAAGPIHAAAELRARIGSRSRQLFLAFKGILTAHKAAERKLGIPVPPDPPTTEEGEQP